LNWCCAFRFSWGLTWQRIFCLALSSLLFLTNSVVVTTGYLNSNHFQYHRICKLKKTLKSNAPTDKIFVCNKRAAGKIFFERTAPKTKSYQRKCAVGKIFWPNPNWCFVLLM